jgi:hypothetical protein
MSRRIVKQQRQMASRELRAMYETIPEREQEAPRLAWLKLSSSRFLFQGPTRSTSENLARQSRNRVNSRGRRAR